MQACRVTAGLLYSTCHGCLPLSILQEPNSDAFLSLAAGIEYFSLAQNSERVADHLVNVAKTIRQLQ